MNVKNTIKSFTAVALSNCTTIISGLIVGFLIPKILTVEGYGFYKTFTLYATYIGFFSLGMIDGIVLDYGDKDLFKLSRKEFRGYFKWYLLIHCIFALILFSLCIFVNNYNLKFILIMSIINMIISNFIGYYQQISQFTQRFKEYSVRKIIQSILNILMTGILFWIYLAYGSINYEWHIITVVLVNAILFVWYLYTYRDITFGVSIKLSELKNQVLHLIKIGFPLLVANLCSTLILTLDRQFVNIFYSTSVYAVYAFAYSILALITVATSAFSTVLYPTLKRTTSETMKENFELLIMGILILVYGAATIYFPLNIFIKWFLPQYKDSLVIFRIIFPGLAISSSVTVVMHNYYKVLGKNLDYFKKTVIVLLISLFANTLTHLCFKSTLSISIASVVTMLFWYLYVERFFVNQYGYNGRKNFAYLLLMLIGFYYITLIENCFIGFGIYFLFYLLGTSAIYHNKLKFYMLKLIAKEKQIKNN